MKKRLVLIVLLFLGNSITLLAQNNKADSSASKNGTDKATVSKTQSDAATKNDKKATEKALKQAAQKRQADSLASLKAAKLALEKSKKDSVNNAKNAKKTAAKAKAESTTPANTTPPIVAKSTVDTTKSATKAAEVAKPAAVPAPNINSPPLVQQSKTDSSKASKKPLSKKELAKLAKANAADSLGSKSKVKPPKVKSAKELKREAKKNDINRLSAQALASMAFKNMSADSSIRGSENKHADIAFTNARPLPLSEPNTRDVKFFHRYWRDIDVTDARNKKFAQYHSDLITALLTAIRTKQIKAYSPVANPTDNPNGDAFTTAIPYDQLMSGLSDTAVVNILDKDGNITGTKAVPNPFTPDKIAGYRIKEDVFYDKNRSKYVTRIIGIAPLVKLTLSSGDLLGIQPLCWIKYKDCRTVFVTIDIDPTKKVGDSMDDVFLQRRFYSRIVQESNPDGKRIKDYKTEPADQEAEAQRMEKKIVVFKKGSWNYVMLAEPPPGADNDKPSAPKTKKATTKTVTPKK